MSKNNLHPIFEEILQKHNILGKPSPTPEKSTCVHPAKISVGDCINSKYGPVMVKFIELMPVDGQVEDGIPMKEVWLSLKDYCVFDLSNGHWARGEDLTYIPA